MLADNQKLRLERTDLTKKLKQLRKEHLELKIKIKKKVSITIEGSVDSTDHNDFEVSDSAIVQYMKLFNHNSLPNILKDIKRAGPVIVTTEDNVIISVDGLSTQGHRNKISAETHKVRTPLKLKKTEVNKEIVSITSRLAQINKTLEDTQVLKNKLKRSIINYIKQHNLTQQQYADLVGVSPTSIRRWLTLNKIVKIKKEHFERINELRRAPSEKKPEAKKKSKPKPKPEKEIMFNGIVLKRLDPIHPLITELRKTKKQVNYLHAKIQRKVIKFDVLSLIDMPICNILAKLIERDGTFCHYCGIPVYINKFSEDSLSSERLKYAPDCATIDHIIPQGLGGWNGMTNYVLGCHSCNTKKGHKLYGHFVKQILEEKEKCMEIGGPNWYLVMTKNTEWQSTQDNKSNIEQLEPRQDDEC